MKTGDYLFLRFNVRGQSKEITAKINLHDFNISHMDKDLITQEIIKHCKLIETGDYEVNRFDF